MVDAFGGSRVQVKPPERGVFPLDHDGECKTQMLLFLKCLKQNQDDNFPCKSFSKDYLQCRMDRGLMAKDDMSNLGFNDNKMNYTRKPCEEGNKEAQGFVAGLNVKGSNKFQWWTSSSSDKSDKGQG